VILLILPSFPKDFFVLDDEEFFFVNQDKFQEIIIQDIDPDEAKNFISSSEAN
jgi:hypothetical protein